MDFSLYERGDLQNNHLDSEKSPGMSLPTEGNDTKYVSGLSTILVASIQEAKDRISQVEYIFCSQLYPNFQKNSKCVQKLYAEARATAEDEWKERVSDLKNRLNNVCVDKERALDDCEVAKTENLKLLERVAELEKLLETKTKESDDGLQSHAKQTKEQEEKTNLLLEKFREQERKIISLSKNLLEKNEEVNKGKELEVELNRKLDTQMQNNCNFQLMLSNSEAEKKQFAMQLENMEARLGDLQIEHRLKINELQEANQSQEQLVEQVNRNDIELTKKNKLLSACEKEKQELLSRINHLENKVEERQVDLRNGFTVMPNVNVLAKQLEVIKCELSIESQRRRDAVAAYKSLKSQQNFLLKKLGLSNEEMQLQIKAEEGGDQLSNDSKACNPHEVKIKDPSGNVFGAELSKVKKEEDSMEISEDEVSGRLNQMSSSRSPPASTSHVPANRPTHTKPGSSTGIKRPAPGWRATRSRQSPGGADPHDDFLDTPFDNIKGNLLNTRVADFDSSDDETQDPRPKPCPDKQVQKAPRIGPKDFKYVGPVRKKSERENLNGIECYQCKKFYDAVLGDDKGKDGEINKQNHRCEHHDGVSRHRYKHLPPMTPEGFWNIGFDTES